MHFRSNKQSNIVKVGGETLFNTYFIAVNGNNIDYKIAFLPILIIKTNSTDLLEHAASKLAEGQEAVIELSTLYHTNGEYIPFDYKLIFTNDGIIDELINNLTIRSNYAADFERELPAAVLEHLNTSLLVIDFGLQTSFEKSIAIGESLISSEGFNRFMVNYFRALNFELQAINVRTFDSSDFSVEFEYSDGYKNDLRLEDEATQRLFVAGTYLLAAFYNGSALFFSSIEDFVPTNELVILINMIRLNENLSGEHRLPCQMIMATNNVEIVGSTSNVSRGRKPVINKDFEIFREQLMVIQNHDNMVYYHWQRNLF